MKNHIKVKGKLLQTNKRFSQLKNSQKDWIAMELYKLYHDKMKERRTTRKLPPNHRDTVISSLYEQIQNREIWILYSEVKNPCRLTVNLPSFINIYSSPKWDFASCEQPGLSSTINHGMLYFAGLEPVEPFIAWTPSHNEEDRKRYLEEYKRRLHNLSVIPSIPYHPTSHYDEHHQLKREYR